MPGPSSPTVATAKSSLGADVDRDGAAVRHGLARIRDQVQEDLLQLVRARGYERARVLVGVDELDALVRVCPPHEVDGRAHDIVECDLVTLVGVLAREVEQRADDLLDLEPRLLDQLEALLRLRLGLGLLEEELRQAEDREQRVVDLVRDAGRELADRGELAALNELLLQAAVVRGVLDQREQQRRLAVVARDRARRDLDRARRCRRAGGRRARRSCRLPRRTRCRAVTTGTAA